MKKAFTLIVLLLAALCMQAATYRNYIGHFIFGTTYTVYVNSDTAFGEDAIGQICYTPNGGGATQYTGFVVGSYDDTTVPGANWKIEITIPAGATSPMLELANENQSNQQYGWTGCNIAMSTVLPVELTHFDGIKSGSSVMLHWTTASEKDNNLFVIERSVDGNDFETNGEVKGAGTSFSSKQYRFEDQAPQTGMNYYRLKTLDTDGKQAYSPVVSVGFSTSAAFVYAYPNPAKDDLKLVVTQDNDHPYTLAIFDFLGKRHLEQSADGIKGENVIEIDVATLPAGVYFVRVNEQSLRLIKI